MKQVLIRSGQAFAEEVPVPQVEPGTALVRVDHSCISIGTELAGVGESGLPLWKKALKRPQNVVKVFKMVSEQGLAKTRSLVEGQLSASQATGYSAAGTVLAVGEGIDDIAVGERVACAGAQYAHHAEVIRVSRNLTVPVPDGVSLRDASTVTLGAIAMQGVRRVEPTLGETFVVIGLGILGQLTVQLLKANGCRVVGIDLDRRRIESATRMGADFGLHPDDADDLMEVARLTDGIGADGVIVTAATPSSEVISTAFQMCRRKGRVVLVGDVGLDIDRADIYQKEIDFLISTSYGPGRYDRTYEEENVDYPIGYVRWTENRNMAEYLRLMAEGKVRLDELVGAVYPIDEATAAYEAAKGVGRPLMILLSYPQDDEPVVTVPNPHAKSSGAGKVRVALVGAGGFAKGMHLPNMQSLSDTYHLRAVCSRTGHNASETAKQFAADYSTTDFEEVLRDSDVDMVLIATRHGTHADMAVAALEAGKHVLVEKPLALDGEELDSVLAFYEQRQDEEGLPILLTGFNRRFSPFGKRMRELTRDRTNPMVIDYRMNAGYISLDHWVHGDAGGGRNIGEACHIYDLFTYLTDSKVADVDARAITPKTGQYGRRDNFVATMTFEDGSVAKLTYTALGSKDFPKERCEVFVDGRVLALDDYKSLIVSGANDAGVTTQMVEKGQKQEIIELAAAIRKGGQWPIPLWHQEQAMRIALQVDEAIRG